LRTPVESAGGVFILAIDPAAFGIKDTYRSILSDCLAALRKAARDHDTNLILPGEPEASTRSRRYREGIPLPAPVAGQLAALAATLGVAALLSAPQLRS
jgi:LDH2 family malate/lactate/ureidoglycolate dehydrogenase